MSEAVWHDRFNKYVEKREPHQCWPWRGSRDGRGYGLFRLGGRVVRAHRAAYILAHPDEVLNPSTDHVLHTCDNPPCCNPQHLFKGDHLLNMQDKERKGRGNHARGQQSGSAVLTPEQVEEIRATNISKYGERARLAKRFGVHPTTISYAYYGKTWR